MMRKASKFRAKSSLKFCLDGLCLSRETAITHIQEHIDTIGLSTDVLRLIELFNIEPEELAEAGLAYEQLKALEQKCYIYNI